MVKILLERADANPDKPDNDCRTSLSHAAFMGREGIVKILLEREEVNPNKGDNCGKTPLMLAISRGHERVRRLLWHDGKVERGSF